MRRAGRLLLLLLAAAPARAEDPKEGPARAEGVRAEAIEIVSGPPASVPTHGSATVVARLRGGYREPAVVLTDPLGDVFFTEPERVSVKGDSFSASLDFPGEDGPWRIEIFARGPDGDASLVTFFLGVGVPLAPPPETGAPPPDAGTGVPPPPPPPASGGGGGSEPSAGEILLRDFRAASKACVAELNRQRREVGVEPLVHDERFFIVLSEAARDMARSGAFGVNRVRVQPSSRASLYHGWGLGIMSNATGSYKSIFSPKDVIDRLGSNPAIRSLWAKGGNNVAAFGFAEFGAEQVFIFEGVGKVSGVERIVAAQQAVEKARGDLAVAEGAARAKIVKRLAEIRSMECAAILGELVSSDPEPEVRKAALGGLVDLGDSTVVDPLIWGLESAPDDALKAAMARGLAAVTGQSFGPDPMRWRAWWSVERDYFRRRK
ncbi:MAG: HEAT repeat domain-containing protein [Planctomycetales bacterium]|nr:HEAT repeat domain-containing protein [Planctomycetales bacterium]